MLSDGDDPDMHPFPEDFGKEEEKRPKPSKASKADKMVRLLVDQEAARKVDLTARLDGEKKERDERRALDAAAKDRRHQDRMAVANKLVDAVVSSKKKKKRSRSSDDDSSK